MMQPVWWVREIDWRISTGIIFFMHLIVWNNREKKKSWTLRVLFCGLVLGMASWSMRYIIEEWLTGKMAVASGYSIFVMVLSLLFIMCYRFCYHVSVDVAIFNSIIALTVYRMSWDAVKLLSTIQIEPEAAWTGGSPLQSLLSYALYLVLCVGCHWLYRYFIKWPVSFPIRVIAWQFVIFLLCQMLLEFTYQFLYSDNIEAGVLFFLTAFLYCIVSFLLLLTGSLMNLLRQENVSMQNFIRSKQQYYEISREGILSLQIKCHDLKHQIARLRSAEGQRQFEKYLKGLSDSIDEYNTVIDSGNKELDVVLTEKNIICSINGVRFTYMIDGKMLDFLTDMEIYALFGNAMDNALEGMQDVQHQEKKFISLRAVEREGRMILVVENYFEHELRFENGLPVTTKEEESIHGFGLRSIMTIARQHGGSASVQAEDHIFKLTVTMQTDQ